MQTVPSTSTISSFRPLAQPRGLLKAGLEVLARPGLACFFLGPPPTPGQGRVPPSPPPQGLLLKFRRQGGPLVTTRGHRGPRLLQELAQDLGSGRSDGSRPLNLPLLCPGPPILPPLPTGRDCGHAPRPVLRGNSSAHQAGAEFHATRPCWAGQPGARAAQKRRAALAEVPGHPRAPRQPGAVLEPQGPLRKGLAAAPRPPRARTSVPHCLSGAGHSRQVRLPYLCYRCGCVAQTDGWRPVLADGILGLASRPAVCSGLAKGLEPPPPPQPRHQGARPPTPPSGPGGLGLTQVLPQPEAAVAQWGPPGVSPDSAGWSRSTGVHSRVRASGRLPPSLAGPGPPLPVSHAPEAPGEVKAGPREQSPERGDLTPKLASEVPWVPPLGLLVNVAPPPPRSPPSALGTLVFCQLQANWAELGGGRHLGPPPGIPVPPPLPLPRRLRLGRAAVGSAPTLGRREAWRRSRHRAGAPSLRAPHGLQGLTWAPRQSPDKGLGSNLSLRPQAACPGQVRKPMEARGQAALSPESSRACSVAPGSTHWANAFSPQQGLQGNPVRAGLQSASHAAAKLTPPSPPPSTRAHRPQPAAGPLWQGGAGASSDPRRAGGGGCPGSAGATQQERDEDVPPGAAWSQARGGTDEKARIPSLETQDSGEGRGGALTASGSRGGAGGRGRWAAGRDCPARGASPGGTAQPGSRARAVGRPLRAGGQPGQGPWGNRGAGSTGRPTLGGAPNLSRSPDPGPPGPHALRRGRAGSAPRAGFGSLGLRGSLDGTRAVPGTAPLGVCGLQGRAPGRRLTSTGRRRGRHTEDLGVPGPEPGPSATGTCDLGPM
ncbi:collagen alpha-1(I) chain-like [Hippopotamus amphibius kiboko]|uniref:collagen alpha-1(I) chain-like n=1 Tax=Hippopotamus amphibius kiboko TaxID=575201 RepID=UPI00259708E7|nr:collagen alpha-1(I) chain-like [Hippopotamus amphibius kiboko]